MGRASRRHYPPVAMKTHIPRHLLVLLTGVSLACAAERVMPSDPGAGSGNTGAAGAGTAGQTMNPPAENTGYARDNRGNTTATDADSSLARGDRSFFEKITRLNEREVALSRLAAERATTPQVRSFAEEMVREHEQAGRELGSLATRKGALPGADDADDSDSVAKITRDWADKKGRDYDEAYLEKMIDAHKDTVDVLEDGADSKDAEIAAAAQKLLPKVKGHLERAKTLHEALD